MVVQAPDARLSRTVGFAAAGGRSVRMGRDKATLPWGRTDLLGHAVDRLRRVTEEVRILSGPDLRHTDRGVPVVVDPAPDLGPLGGLLAALRAAEGRSVLLLAVDLPLVPVELLAHLVSASPPGRHSDAALAVVPSWAGGPEPLCALYRPACRGPVERAVEAGRLKMTGFWPGVRVREVPPAELAPFGDPEVLFLNVNDREDYERATNLASITRRR